MMLHGGDLRGCRHLRCRGYPGLVQGQDDGQNCSQRRRHRRYGSRAGRRKSWSRCYAFQRHNRWRICNPADWRTPDRPKWVGSTRPAWSFRRCHRLFSPPFTTSSCAALVMAQRLFIFRLTDAMPASAERLWTGFYGMRLRQKRTSTKSADLEHINQQTTA